MRTKYWWALIIVLIGFNAYLFYKRFHAGNTVTFRNNLAINTEEDILKALQKLQNLKLVYTSNLPVDVSQSLNTGKFKLLIFFSPNDCPACLKEISLWNRLSEALPVKVIGLVPHYNAGEISYFILNEDIKFEVWIDLEQKLYEYIDFSETPVKVLIDKHNDVISMTKSFLNKKYEEAYFNYIEELTE